MDSEIKDRNTVDDVIKILKFYQKSGIKYVELWDGCNKCEIKNLLDIFKISLEKRNTVMIGKFHTNTK